MATTKKNKKDEEISVIAELTVTSPQGKEIVRSFDTAWHRGLERPVPVHIKFNAFVRKD